MTDARIREIGMCVSVLSKNKQGSVFDYELTICTIKIQNFGLTGLLVVVFVFVFLALLSFILSTAFNFNLFNVFIFVYMCSQFKRAFYR